jgi:hypothetical protein
MTERPEKRCKGCRSKKSACTCCKECGKLNCWCYHLNNPESLKESDEHLLKKDYHKLDKKQKEKAKKAFIHRFLIAFPENGFDKDGNPIYINKKDSKKQKKQETVQKEPKQKEKPQEKQELPLTPEEQKIIELKEKLAKLEGKE